MTTRYATRLLFCLLSGLILLGTGGRAQQLPSSQPQPPQVLNPFGSPSSDPDNALPFRDRQRRLLIEDRYRHINDDAVLIAQLTQKLQESLRDHPDLTDDDRKLLLTIEKLSHDAQNRMKQ